MEINVRPVPIPDPVTQFFWDSAKEGKLSVQGFEGTDILQHPPSPVPEVPRRGGSTPYCRRGERTRDPVRVHGSAPAVPSRFRRRGADDHRSHRARRRPGRPDTHQHRRSRSGRAAVRAADGGGLRTARRVRAAAVSAPRRLEITVCAARRSTSSGTTGARAEGPRVIACSLISGRSTDGSRVSNHATASATSAARIAYISNGTSGQHVGLDRPRCHDVDVDAVAVDLLGQRSRERVHTGLRRRIRSPRRHRFVGGRRRDEHEAGTHLHPRQRSGGDDETRVQIGRDRRPPFLESLLAGVCSAEDAGRVHQQIDLAGRFHRRRELLRVGRVGDHVARADLLRRSAQGLLPPGGEDHVIAELSELATACFSNAAAATGDQGRTHTAPFNVGGGPTLAAREPRSAARDRPR